MRVQRSAYLIAVGLLGITGCVNPQHTHLPSLAANEPRAEMATYRYFDPYPEQGSGPATYNRPRGFDVTRTEPRTIQERYSGTCGGASNGVMTPTTWNYDRVGRYRDVVRD